MFSSLCEHCAHVRRIVTGKGSQFLLCERALADPRYLKYPPQPLLRCAGFTPRSPENHGESPSSRDS